MRVTLICLCAVLLAGCARSELWSRGRAGGVQAVLTGDIEFCKRRLPEGKTPTEAEDTRFADYCNRTTRDE